MKYLLYFFSCFFKKEQQNDIMNPLYTHNSCDSYNSCDTVDCNNNLYYITRDSSSTNTSPKKVRFSSFTDEH